MNQIKMADLNEILRFHDNNYIIICLINIYHKL